MTTIDNSGNIHGTDGRFAGHVGATNNDLSGTLGAADKPDALGILAEQFELFGPEEWDRVFPAKRAGWDGDVRQLEYVISAVGQAGQFEEDGSEEIRVAQVRGADGGLIITGTPDANGKCSAQLVSVPAELCDTDASGRERARQLALFVRRTAKDLTPAATASQKWEEANRIRRDAIAQSAKESIPDIRRDRPGIKEVIFGKYSEGGGYYFDRWIDADDEGHDADEYPREFEELANMVDISGSYRAPGVNESDYEYSIVLDKLEEWASRR